MKGEDFLPVVTIGSLDRFCELVDRPSSAFRSSL
jgi:hypothetical protein